MAYSIGLYSIHAVRGLRLSILQKYPSFDIALLAVVSIILVFASIHNFHKPRKVKDSPSSFVRSGTSEKIESVILCNAPPTLPRGFRFQTNDSRPQRFETDLASGEFLWMHRPTGNPASHQAGNYPYADHIHGRKRLWEMRFRFRVKEAVGGSESALWFGLEQDKYYWPGHIQYRLGQAVVAAMRGIVGEVFQTVGEDPQRAHGEVERPQIAFPLWVLDQIIETPEGEEPPDLCDPDFGKFGMIKTDNRKAFRKRMDELVLRPGRTYTFALWCVARFADWILWNMTGVPWIPDSRFADVGIHGPIYLVMYRLREAENPRDKRHMDSRKDYMFRVASWSSIFPASESRQKDLLTADNDHVLQKSSSSARQKTGFFSSFLDCCGR